MMVAVELALDLDLTADDLRLRTLVPSDAALVVEATRHESAPALWGPRPAGPYPLDQAVAVRVRVPAEDNAAAAALYRRNGFRRTGAGERFMPDGVRTEYVMAKPLATWAG